MLTYKGGQDGDSPWNNRKGAHLKCPHMTAHAYSTLCTCLQGRAPHLGCEVQQMP